MPCFNHQDLTMPRFQTALMVLHAMFQPSRPHYAKVPNCFDGSPCHVSTIKTSLCQGSKLLWWFSMPCFNHQDLTMPRFQTALMVLHAMFQPSRPHYAKIPNCFDGSPCHVSTIKTSLCQGSKLLWWFSMPCFNHQDLTMPRFQTALMVLHAMFQPSRPHYAKVPNCFDGSPCHVSTIKTSLCQGSKLLWWFSMPCFNHQDLTMPRFQTALMVLHAMFQPSRPHYAKVPNCFDGSPCHVSTIKTSLCQGF